MHLWSVKHLGGLRTIVLACLAVLFVIAGPGDTWAARSLTLEEQAFARSLTLEEQAFARSLTLEEQAHFNVLRKYRPDFADQLLRRLNRLEKKLEKRSDLTEEQKKAARRKVVLTQIRKARVAIELANKLGGKNKFKQRKKLYVFCLQCTPFIFIFLNK
jgi:hypothetical protein